MRLLFSLVLYFLTTVNVISQEQKTEFADLLVEAYYSNENKDFKNFYGGTLKNFPVAINPEVVLGGNTSFFISLPTRSYVVVKFTDNSIFDYKNQDDIFITEMGCSGERADVYVSTDGVDFIKLGTVDDCKTSSLDLNKISFKSVVKYVKIVGLDAKGGSPGYDLVSVKGLINSSVDSYIDLSQIDIFLNNPEQQHGQKVILNNVNFTFNSTDLNEESKKSLSKLYLALKQYPNMKFKITGHTDNVGKEDFNLKLSLERAKAVSMFLISKGIVKDRIQIEGKGQLEPIKNNETEEGRNLNRRVELEIVK